MKIVVCLIAMLLVFNASNAKEWRGIKPLYSTRQDVERLIGQPIFPSTYVIDNEAAFITYSDGFCSSSKDWNVQKDTVIDIRVNRRSGFSLFSELKLDKNKFKIKHTFHSEHIQYWNEEDGIFYDVIGGKYVQAATYIPSAKDNHLHCPASKITVDELRNF
jgi:hypothetical protein